MSDVAIRVEGLGKKYRLGAKQQSYGSLRETLTSVAQKPLQLARQLIGRDQGAATSQPEFWALKDVSLEVKHGEVLGVIGRNGAGKSTFLKLLSEITEPTLGRITINGRVASLLEVGTGFHPELTGRENIFLNGAIMGMRKAEIAQKFDEIVAFAEVEKFIDTQVKHYSSGMYLRLAFSVAAHLEPDILMVDEVLAVGDHSFQRKCLGKMHDVASTGRTVLFVSHNLGAVERLCQRGILLEHGSVGYDDSIHSVLLEYLRRQSSSSSIYRHGPLSVSLDLRDENEARLQVWKPYSHMTVHVRVESKHPVSYPAADIVFYSESGVRIAAIQSDKIQGGEIRGPVCSCHFSFLVHNSGLACDQLTVDVGIRTDRDPRYTAWWQAVETLLVSQSELPYATAPDTVLALPVSVRATFAGDGHDA